MKNFLDLSKRKIIIAMLVAALYSVISVLCSYINPEFEFETILLGKSILRFLVTFILSGIVVIAIYTLLDIVIINTESKSKEVKIGKFELFKSDKKNFIIVFLFILICFLPYFLKYYPGFLTFDSIMQSKMAIGVDKITDHHPIIHTGIIALFLNIGLKVFSNINIGVALYTLFQIIIMDLFFTIVLMNIYKGKSLVLKVLSTLFYALYPLNPFMSLEMWKDVIFSGIIPVFIMISYNLVTDTEEYLSKVKNIVIYIIVSVLVCLLRHNGFYVVLLTAPFYVIGLRKYYKKVLLMFLCIFVLFFTIRFNMYFFLHIEKESSVEMLSIPLQQLTRIQVYQSDNMTQEEKDEINRFFVSDKYIESYNPWLSDAVKMYFNNDYFSEHKVEFVLIWVKDFFKFPTEYIKSFLANSCGYYYTGINANRNMIDNSVYPNEIGIEADYKIESKLLDRLLYTTTKDARNNVLLHLFYNIGIMVWSAIVLFSYKFYQKDYRVMLIYVPIIVLWLTCIAGPLNSEFRYVYAILISLPLFVKYTENSHNDHIDVV